MTTNARRTLMLALMCAAALLLAGCGGGDDAEKAAPAAEATTEAATDAAAQTATHDCDGGCGMKDVPMDQLTEIDGKYYCAGCAKKAQEEHDAAHDHG